MKTILSIFLLCLTLLPAVSPAAPNEEVPPQNNLLPPQERPIDRGPRISQNRASEIVQEAIPGSRVLNVQRENQNWRVRVDQEGNVSDVLVNAESGRMSRSNRE